MNPKNNLNICDTETEEVIPVPLINSRPEHRPFGISWWEDKLLIAQPTAILQFNKRLKSPQIILDHLEFGIHQITVKDNCLWMVSPRINGLQRYNLLTRQLDNFLPHGKKNRDVHHYNSILIKEDKLYLSAHNNNLPSFISVYSYPELKLLTKHEDLGRQIHNIYIEDNEIYTLDSLGTQAIISTKGKYIPVGKKGEFIRGLAVTPQNFIVSCFPYSPAREFRREGKSDLVIIDRKDGKVSKRISVGNTGNINDIRILDEQDLAHDLKPFWDEKDYDLFRRIIF